jgi:hypothetical protein
MLYRSIRNGGYKMKFLIEDKNVLVILSAYSVLVIMLLRCESELF